MSATQVPVTLAMPDVSPWVRHLSTEVRVFTAELVEALSGRSMSWARGLGLVRSCWVGEGAGAAESRAAGVGRRPVAVSGAVAGRRKLATASHDRTIRLWSAPDGTELGVFCGHGGNARSVAFSPDGSRLASASDEVMDVAWSPDGTRLATASYDKTVRIWEAVTEGAALVERARSRVFRRLSQDERHTLMIPAPRPAPDGERSPA